MKLSSIKQNLIEALPLIESLTLKNIPANQSIQFNNVKNFKKGFEKLKSINVLDEFISDINHYSILNTSDDSIMTNNSDAKEFKNKVQELSKFARLLLRSFENIVFDSDDEQREKNSIYIKLPNTNNLADFARDIQTFNKILSNTILDENINGQITLEGVETGSIWLKIYVGSTIAVNLVAGLAWSSAVIYKKYQEAQIIEQIVEQQKLENDNRKNIINATQLLTNIIIQAEAENLYNTYYKNHEVNPEQIESIKASIKMLSEEIHKGAEITPSLAAPEEVANLFPDMKALPTIESKIKKIE